MTRWRLLQLLLAALAYVLIAKVSNKYFVGPEVIAFFWPPSGFMLAVFLLSPRREWVVQAPVFAAGNALANYLQDDTLTISLGFGLANTVESLGAAFLVTHFLRGPITMVKLRDVLGLLGLAAVASNAVTAWAGATVVHLGFGAPLVDSWLVWWLADSLGMLLVTPLIVSWATTWHELKAMPRARVLEGALLLIGMLAVAFFVFDRKLAADSQGIPLPYTTFPFLLWAAVRFGSRGGSLAALALAVVAVWFTLQGKGPFGATGLATQRVLAVQAFLAVASLCSLMLAAVIHERELADEALRSINATLEERIKARTRELERSNAELEQFAYAASHDLQEPLRAVAGTTSLLHQRYKGQLDAKAEELIEHTIDGVARMKALITDLLAYARVGAEAPPANPCDSAAIVQAALGNLATAVNESGAAVVYTGLPAVKGDSTQIVQLFQNLVGNAIKFRGERKPEIQITAQAAGPEVSFAVKDNGIGIEPQYYDRIFGVFQRLHTRKAYPGTGIGLAICKKIVERHGGRIWVESEPGRGTAFHFTLPSGAT